jgi:excisionase family DNA binding protein
MSESNGTGGADTIGARDILTIEEAAALLGVSVKTFNKVLHTQDLPARKIGREWKFSRRALIEWVGSGRSKDFYNAADGSTPAARSEAPDRPIRPERTRRTAGWNIEY